MRPALLQREIALAAVALVAALAALGAAANAGDRKQRKTLTSVPVPGVGWYRALAAPYPESAAGRRTSCGQRLDSATLGVSHPALPCGIKIVIAYGGKTALTQVVDRGSAVPGREFDVTPALAERMGLEGTQLVRWRYAR